MHKTPAVKDHSVLLGDLHADKVYLEQLLQNPGSRFHTLSALISFPEARPPHFMCFRRLFSAGDQQLFGLQSQ